MHVIHLIDAVASNGSSIRATDLSGDQQNGNSIISDNQYSKNLYTKN